MNKIDTEVIKFALAQSPHLTDEQIATDYKVSTEDVASIRTPSPSTKKETLKEYARRYILEMSEDEKKEFVRKIPAELLWKMSEGMPATTGTLDLTNSEPIRIDISHQLLQSYGPTSATRLREHGGTSRLPSGSSQ